MSFADAKRSLRQVCTACLGLVFVLPPVLLVAGSLRTPGLVPPDGFEILPRPLRWANYADVLDFSFFGRGLVHSAFVVVLAVPLTVLVASLAGFAIVVSSARMRSLSIAISLAAVMIPASALWVPRFAIFRWLGLTDTLAPLVMPALMGTSPFYVLLFAFTYWRIPKSLYESAAVEGVSPLKIWRRVALPLGRPALFAVSVLAFATHWSSFVEPLLYLASTDLQTAPVALRALQTLEPANYPLLLSASVIATLPPVLAFLAAHRALFHMTFRA